MKKEVVEINTQEEWDYVVSKLGFSQFKSKTHEYDKVYRWVKINEFGYNDNYQLYEKQGYTIISFNEFKSRYEPQLKIGDTFEYNGFVCEVLHQIDEKKWFILKSPNNKDISYEKLDNEGLKDINHLYTKQEITNREFIKQLEENAR